MIGFIVGVTTSGKSIIAVTDQNAWQDSVTTAYKDFVPKDFFEAYAVFEYLTIREVRKNNLNENFLEIYKSHAHNIRNILLGSKNFSKYMRLYNIKTSIDVVSFGRNLARPEFRD